MAALTLLMVLIAITLPEGARASPDVEEMANVAEALKNLDLLDKYYAQWARPRFVIRKYYSMKFNIIIIRIIFF